MIRPKSAAKFPKNRADWRWLFPVIPERLKKLHDEGFGVVIFTNQAGIGKGHVKATDIKGKILDLQKEVCYRFWRFILSLYNSTNMNLAQHSVACCDRVRGRCLSQACEHNV